MYRLILVLLLAGCGDISIEYKCVDGRLYQKSSNDLWVAKMNYNYLTPVPIECKVIDNSIIILR